jgi:hypothetical protein
MLPWTGQGTIASSRHQPALSGNDKLDEGCWYNTSKAHIGLLRLLPQLVASSTWLQAQYTQCKSFLHVKQSAFESWHLGSQSRKHCNNKKQG